MPGGQGVRGQGLWEGTGQGVEPQDGVGAAPPTHTHRPGRSSRGSHGRSGRRAAPGKSGRVSPVTTLAPGHWPSGLQTAVSKWGLPSCQREPSRCPCSGATVTFCGASPSSLRPRWGRPQLNSLRIWRSRSFLRRGLNNRRTNCSSEAPMVLLSIVPIRLHQFKLRDVLALLLGKDSQHTPIRGP